MIARKGIFTDLDNTIIFSHRHEIGEREPVEEINGKKQAYMTKRGYELLQNTAHDQFIPITSRTLAQYRRISFYCDGSIPRYALIDNGGILLVEGKADTEWLNETTEMIAEDRAALNEFVRLFSTSADIKWQDDMVLFVKTDGSLEEIDTAVRDLGLMTFRHMNKIYVCSDKLTKGKAIRRFKKRYPIDCTIAAGDSEVDLSMIPEADEAYMALQLEELIEENDRVHLVDAVDIAEYIFGLSRN